MSLYALSFVAGGLSAFSPCVLPTFPLVAGSALQAHRYGPVAVAAGMIVSFTTVAVALNATGSLFGLSGESVTLVSASLLILFGMTLTIQLPATPASSFVSRLASAANNLLSKVSKIGLWGQFLVGALLGAIWMPCAGPILGAAFTMAAEGTSLGKAAAIMALFGLGASFPMLLVAYVSRRLFSGSRWIETVQKKAKFIFGIVLIGFGVAALTGLDKTFEAMLVARLPDWLLSITTRY